jgi:hypothetical protein
MLTCPRSGCSVSAACSPDQLGQHRTYTPPHLPQPPCASISPRGNPAVQPARARPCADAGPPPQSGAARVLVASDALTRGMDVPGVAAVVNYDAPTFAKTYVHRAGRTARAGQQGARPVRVGGGH